jgi:hypothetical protein
MKKLILFMTVSVFFFSCTKMQEVDLIVYNGHIYSVDSSFGVYEAMAIKDGNIVKIGSNDQINSEYWAQEKTDLKNKFVYPGFIDAHSHFISYGLSKVIRADLTGTTSFDEIIERLKKFETEYPAEWLVGRGWDQNDWENNSFPTKEKLDELWPNKAVYLTRIDGHAALLNSKALELSGISGETKIDGGEIVLEEGEPTGVILDNAMEVVRAVMPETSSLIKTKAIEIAEKDCFAAGLTSVCDAGLEAQDIELLRCLQEESKLKMRVYAMLTPTPETLEKILKKGQIITDHLSVRSIKLYADGALGSRGACLIHDYHDRPNWKGMILSPTAYYDSLCQLANKYDYQVNTHAIGDSANRIMLQLYSKYLEENNDKRWRIEHAQVVHPDDFHYFGDYNIVPSVQPTHATSDMYWADERLGPERIKSAYAYEELRKQNSWIPLGTDFPIESIDPLLTYYAAVVRRDLKDYPDSGFQMENALSRTNALKGITIWAAKAAFEESKKGSLEAGKFADFVVLNKDLMHVQDKEIPQLQILRTYIDGQQVYMNSKIQ